MSRQFFSSLRSRVARRLLHRAQQRYARLHFEPLEPRALLATLVSATTVSYQDVDGDDVTVVLSKPILTAGNVNTLFTVNVGMGDGSNALKEQLTKIDLTGHRRETQG